MISIENIAFVREYENSVIDILFFRCHVFGVKKSESESRYLDHREYDENHRENKIYTLSKVKYYLF